MNKVVDVSKPLEKIVTVIDKGEYYLHSIEWIFADGSME